MNALCDYPFIFSEIADFALAFLFKLANRFNAVDEGRADDADVLYFIYVAEAARQDGAGRTEPVMLADHIFAWEHSFSERGNAAEAVGNSFQLAL